ncbi:MAG: winged helix-turn-helix transcriptional regulator [Kangiella sp.]|nr:winged helix-turn-helix transcriptional regulator [Kangiella sp.]
MDVEVDIAELKENARNATALLKTMSNEWRLLILCQLAEGEKSFGELEGLIGLSQSALSQHLAILRRENLVKTRRSAQSIYYSLSSHEAESVMMTLYSLYCDSEACVTTDAAE